MGLIQNSITSNIIEERWNLWMLNWWPWHRFSLLCDTPAVARTLNTTVMIVLLMFDVDIGDRCRVSNSYFGCPCFSLSQVCGLGGVHSIFTLVTLHLLVTTVFATLGDKYWNSWLVAGSQGVSLLLQAVRAIWGWGWSATVWWKSSTKLGQWYDGIWYALQALSSRLWVWQADVDGEQLSEIIRLQSRKPW